MSLWKLFSVLVSGQSIRIVSVGLVPYEGTIQAIEKEDGSGHNWNVTINDKILGRRTVFVQAE